MTKAQIRASFGAQRKALSHREVNIRQDLLLIRFQQMRIPDARLVHTYHPLHDRNEPDPAPLVSFMRFQNPALEITSARINTADFSMFHFLQDDDMIFEINQYGIPEPIGGIEVLETDIDIAFIPLLAFDKKGNRVGYGKGYYDRFLAKCRKDVLKIGLSFFPPVDSIEDVDFFDKKLDFCITPERVYAF